VLLTRDDLEVVVQQPRSEDLHLWLLFATLGDELLLALANLGQFAGVRVRPGGCLFTRHFEMELHTDDVAPPEHLVPAELSLDEQLGAVGYLKGVAVPVKDGEAGWESIQERVFSAGRGQVYLVAADLYVFAPSDACTQDLGQDLRATADAQARFPGVQGPSQVRNLGLQERVLVRGISRDRRPADENSIKRRKRGQGMASIGVHHLAVDPLSAKMLLIETKALDFTVLEGQDLDLLSPC
jgi:hypothetical protein